MVLTCSSVVLAADDVTSSDVALAVQQGQWFLFGQQQPDGHFSRGPASYSDYPLATTCMAVSALLDTGVPASDPHIIAGIDYILSFWDDTQQKFIPEQTWHETYETGIILMALSLYGSATDAEEDLFPGFSDKVQAAYDHLLSYQHNEDNGITSDDAFYGGWYYDSSYFGWADMSNTQYAALGLWYASRYLDYSMDEAEWADRLLMFVTRCHGWDATNDESWADGRNDINLDGAFSYEPDYASFYPGGCQTGAGLWNLAMIGEDQNPIVDIAIDWFRHNYTWAYTTGSYYAGQKNAYYYFIFSMGKALTAFIPPDEIIFGDISWSQDLLNNVIPQKILISGDIISDDQIVSGDVGYWPASNSHDGNDSIATSFVLMTLAFADTSTESNEKHLAQPDGMTNPIQGKVTIRTSGGVTISGASREDASFEGAEFPIGAFSFILNNVPEGGSVIIRFEPPAEGFNPDNPYAFVDADGAPKNILCWMRSTGIDWTMLQGVTVNVDTDGKFIEITLTDNGAGDSDDIPGQITVTSSALALYESEGGNSRYGSGGCQIGSLSPLMMLLLPLAWLIRR